MTFSASQSRVRRCRKRAVLLTLLGAGVAGSIRADRWQRSWGTTPAERERQLPGDEIVPVPGIETTRAIGIKAPPVKVWPWLVQIGLGKAGFYSIDRLERMIGLDVTSADAIHPEWQDLEVGGEVQLGPGISLRAAVVDKDSALVLEPGDSAEQWGLPDEFSWAFVLEPEGPAGTRLLIRERYGWSKRWMGAWFRLITWASWVMTRAMLKGIRERAERE